MMDLKSPLDPRASDILGSPLLSNQAPRLNCTPTYTTPKAGSRSLTPVYRVSQNAGRNTPVYRVSLKRDGTPDFRPVNSTYSVTRTPVSQVRRNCTPVSQIRRNCTPVSQIRRNCTPVSQLRKNCTPMRCASPSLQLLKNSCKRRSVANKNSPICDSVFSPRTPMLSSPCNREYLILQEKQLRHAWRLSVSESPGSLRLTERHSTPQRSQDAITVKKLVGSGGFGSVYIGTYKSQKVAIKYMRKQVKNCAAHFENFLAELRVMSLNHDNILKTVAASDPLVYDREAFLVMEYVDGRNLLQLIEDKDVSFSLDRRVKYGRQIATALEYCHTNNLMHLDIKPANILVNNADDCKVADFGCCQFVEPDNHANSSAITGTYAYRAPELLRGARPTIKADIYALGMTLWQMQSRQKPYRDQDQHVTIFAVVAYNLRPPIVEDTTTVYSDLYRQCWDRSPDVRPSASCVSEHLHQMLENETN